jgi:hypothetical protein
VEQFATAKAAPAAECGGALVCCQSVKWQPEVPQAVGAMVNVKLLLMWQEVQDTLACPLVSRNPVVLWSNVAEFQLTVVWQVEQFVAANWAPAVECTGLLVCCQVVRWQPEFPQSVGAMVNVKLLLMWQEVQATLAWPLVSRNPVVLWSNVAEFQLTVVWQVEQFVAANWAPAVECMGLFVCCQVVRWQPEFPQSVGAIVNV